MKTKGEIIMNIKKIGLSALAGSLAMVSANAVELAVSGKTEITYVSKSGDASTAGNPFGMGNAITFAGSGDMNGMTATYTAVLQDGGTVGTNNQTFASSSLMLDMGDMGTVGFDQGVGEFGVSTIDDKMPYAYEEIWTYVGSSNGLRAAGGPNVIGYKNTFSGVNLSLELDPGHKTGAINGASGDGGSSGLGTTDSGYNVALTSSNAGVTYGVGYGTEEHSDTSTNAQDDEFMTGFITYAIGGATIGYQQSEGNGGASGAASNQVEIMGVSFSVNENLAVSMNQMDNEYGKSSATHITSETTGFGASYTMGSAAVRVLASEVENAGGAKSTDNKHVEVSLMLAF
jgi:outer membrane protein OmpU